MIWNILSLLAALAAGAYNAYVGWRAYNTNHPTISKAWRIRAITAALAFGYSAAYVWLILGLVDVATWSTTLRPWGIITWLTVWLMDADNFRTVMDGTDRD